MKRLRTKKAFTLALTAALVMSTLVLGACGNNSSANSDAGAALTTEAEPESSAAPTTEAATVAEETTEYQFEETERTVKFRNSLDWSGSIYVYYWSDKDDYMTSWPGVVMEQVDDYYALNIPDDAEYIIFNNNDKQTADLIFDGSIKEFQISEKKFSDGTYSVEDWRGKELSDVLSYTEEKEVKDVKIDITDKQIVEDYKSGSLSGDDALIFTILNKTDADISDIKIYMVAYDKDGNQTKIEGKFHTTDIYESKAKIYSSKISNTVIAPGKSDKAVYLCEADNIVKVDAVVASYISNKTLYTNAKAEDWADGKATETAKSVG